MGNPRLDPQFKAELAAFLQKFELRSINPLSTGIGLGKIDMMAPKAQPFSLNEETKVSAKKEVETPAPLVKNTSFHARPEEKKPPRKNKGLKFLLAHLIDMGLITGLVFVIVLGIWGFVFDEIWLSPYGVMKFVKDLYMDRHKVIEIYDLVVVIYAVFFGYAIFFRLVCGGTIGEYWLKLKKRSNER